MKKEKIIYCDLMRIAQLADAAAVDLAKSEIEDRDTYLRMMSYSTLEFVSAYLLHRHFSLANELTEIPLKYKKFLEKKANDGPPGLKEYFDANIETLESLLEMDDK